MIPFKKFDDALAHLGKVAVGPVSFLHQCHTRSTPTKVTWKGPK